MSSDPHDPAADGQDSGDGTSEPDGAPALPVSRRALLGGAAVAGAGLVGAATILGGPGDGNGGSSASDDASTTDTPRQTTPVTGNEARRLAERFAPTLSFGRRERWFPTDPRPYTSERDGETVVDGFDALDGYTAAKADGTRAPDPTVFYHVLEYTEELAVVQYWLYSAFDQFSVNFHWHDWELLQAFVDRESDDPVLYVASAHSRRVPNNEFLDPGRTPAIISEVGSHSSALGMNERRDTFQRLPADGLVPDVTNGVLAIASGEEGLPLAYGLPRDEGFRLPYVVPELDGAPLSDHPDLPNVSADSLVSGALLVSSFTDLGRPPTDLPARERGPVFEPESRGAVDADERYALAPTADVEDIAAFTGPQLSFDFYVPGFVEDALSSHLTTTSPPWTQSRYLDPLADVTDGAHREALGERYGLDTGDTEATVVGRLREVRPTDDADVGVTLAAPPVEAVARLASDPVAVPTFGGVAAFVDVEPGDHTLTVNGPGYAPYAQEVRVGDDGRDSTATTNTEPTGTGTVTTSTDTQTETTTAAEPSPSAGGTVRVGSDGQVGLVPNEDAVKLQVDAADRGGARRVRVEDDTAGAVFDAAPVGQDGRGSVYVHRAGGYVVEVTDTRGETSVERVNPGPDQNAAEVAKARTGVSGVTRFLVDFLTETRETVERLLRRSENGGRGGRQQSNGNGRSNGTASDDGDESESEDGDDDGDESDERRTATPEPTDEPSAGAPTASDRLTAALDEAVAHAEEADEAARADDTAAAAAALRALREGLEALSAFATREDAPQPASRIAANRAETADARAARALESLSSTA